MAPRAALAGSSSAATHMFRCRCEPRRPDGAGTGCSPTHASGLSVGTVPTSFRPERPIDCASAVGTRAPRTMPTLWQPRPDSNRGTWFRKPPLYPTELRGQGFGDKSRWLVYRAEGVGHPTASQTRPGHVAGLTRSAARKASRVGRLSAPVTAPRFNADARNYLAIELRVGTMPSPSRLRACGSPPGNRRRIPPASPGRHRKPRQSSRGRAAWCAPTPRASGC